MEITNCKKTKSEKLFEQFCQRNCIICEPVDVNSTRTPDYQIITNNIKIIIEIKELDLNKEDKESEKLL